MQGSAHGQAGDGRRAHVDARGELRLTARRISLISFASCRRRSCQTQPNTRCSLLPSSALAKSALPTLPNSKPVRLHPSRNMFITSTLAKLAAPATAFFPIPPATRAIAPSSIVPGSHLLRNLHRGSRGCGGRGVSTSPEVRRHGMQLAVAPEQGAGEGGGGGGGRLVDEGDWRLTCTATCRPTPHGRGRCLTGSADESQARPAESC